VNKAQSFENTNSIEIKHVFEDFALRKELKDAIRSRGYTQPTPIQDQAIPVILQGRDVIGIANTGTGKTAAFLLPLINKALTNRSEKVLIIAPTRELAVQINDELHLFAKGMGIYSVTAIGGSGMQGQIANLHKGYNFLIATPGRLKDLIQHRAVNLSTFHNVVLDEVDRMVDIGFIRDITHIIALLPKERHSLFFSATVTPKVEEVLRPFVHNPVTISVKTHNTAATIEQDVIKVGHKEQKIDLLHDLLIKDGFEKVMVFGRTKWGVEKLSKALNERGFRTASIHGNKTQGQRLRALNAFKSNEIQVLLATDVASRGIDVEDVTHVINYDAPESYDDYVHRIGRTGRANKTGVAITFVE
jgi:superfamily II DNA/RNA helicase